MISERKFISAYTSFWRDLLPMGDAFIRRQNLESQRFEVPLDSKLSPERRSLVNELAFRLFSSVIASGKQSFDGLLQTTIGQVANETARYIRRFAQFSKNNESLPTEAETREALLLGKRILLFFKSRVSGGKEIIIYPKFKGCGAVDECEADVLANTTLYEIKSTDRTFRLIDVKQVLVYCALNYVNPSYNIDQVAIVNPRRGVFFSQQMEALARSVSGSGASELCSDIIDFISFATPSR